MHIDSSSSNNKEWIQVRNCRYKGEPPRIHGQNHDYHCQLTNAQCSTKAGSKCVGNRIGLYRNTLNLVNNVTWPCVNSNMICAGYSLSFFSYIDAIMLTLHTRYKDRNHICVEYHTVFQPPDLLHMWSYSHLHVSVLPLPNSVAGLEVPCLST